MTLNFKKSGQGPALLILHGVFGSLDNWQTIARELESSFTVYLIDQRNHGLSFHSDDFNYPLMSQDIMTLAEAEGLEKFHILGHSMGGKTAMFVACQFSSFVESLIVVDIAPRHYLPHHQQIFEGFRSVKLKSITSRKEAESQMAGVIENFGVRQFILKNLQRKEDGFRWKLNLDVIESNIENVGAAVPSDYEFQGPTLFVAGGNSNYILAEDIAQIEKQFPTASIEVIDGAGHWVHAEKPKPLIEKVREFLSHRP